MHTFYLLKGIKKILSGIVFVSTFLYICEVLKKVGDDDKEKGKVRYLVTKKMPFTL